MNDIVEWAINVTGLRGLANRYVSTLSGGERVKDDIPSNVVTDP